VGHYAEERRHQKLRQGAYAALASDWIRKHRDYS
jgi:hypothetical protein